MTSVVNVKESLVVELSKERIPHEFDCDYVMQSSQRCGKMYDWRNLSTGMAQDNLIATGIYDVEVTHNLESLATYISSHNMDYTILTDKRSLIQEKETHTKACKYRGEVSKQIAFSNGIHCAEWRAHLWVPGFQHFTPSELIRRSSYNVTFVALKPYPVWSNPLHKITLINVAVKTGIENNKQE